MNTECSTDSRLPTLVPVIARVPCPRLRGHGVRRVNRVSLGFWLGAAAFATGGGVLGACMPYHHPVAIAISVIWWGFYIGCLGASLGALVGLFIQCAPSSGRTEAVDHQGRRRHTAREVHS
jgi:hypothetical protein